MIKWYTAKVFEKLKHWTFDLSNSFPTLTFFQMSAVENKNDQLCKGLKNITAC